MSDYNEKLREDFGRRAKAATQAVTDASITGKDLERFKAQMAVINGIIDDNGLMSEAMSALETLELMASNLTSAPAPTGGTPVPAPAAPPPVAPAPAPSPAPDWEKFMGDLRKTIDPVVEAMPRNQDGQIIPAASQAQVNWLSARTAVLETEVKAINTNAGRVKAPLKKVWPSLGLGLLVGLLIGLGLFSLVGIVVAIVLGVVGFALVAAVMIALFNSDRNTAPAQ